MSGSPAILITGASSGLGLAFLNHYASLPTTDHIIALDTHPLPEATHTLPTHISFYNVDTSDEEQISDIALETMGVPISLLIHCAGTRGLVPETLQERKDNARENGRVLGEADVAEAETYQVMDQATMMRALEVNAFGTFNVLSSFVPYLLEGKGAKVVVLSSRMGSVGGNEKGGGYAYRASKAALNAVVKSFSVDVPGVQFLLLHPGRVETGLVEWKEEGAISVEESVSDCMEVIERWGREGSKSGMFVDRFGVEIPW
jgi:NAD(P)-dependent dehydrogenase (short-subunit alcohol dehydrogenase family)